MFSKYRFKAYHDLCDELADCAAIVQSEKLSVALHESIQAVRKLVVLCQEKEAHIQRRARQQYGTLRYFALYALGKLPLTHSHDDCRDDQPRHWADDCPRCLAVALAVADERPLPGNKKHQPRRAFTIAEFKSLLSANPGRRDIYLTAGLSGLRKGELRQLERRDVSPLATPATWRLRPEIAKGRRKDVVPILPELLTDLCRIWKTAKRPTDRLFDSVPLTRTFHGDLRRAGIERFDGEGKRIVFHSLRYFFCTLLAKTLPIQVVRLLMRHKTIKQTCDLYMDLGLTDVAEAVIQLPPTMLDGPK